MASDQLGTMLHIVKGLRRLEEIERDKGELYEALAERFADDHGAGSLFRRIGLDQVSRRNVIQYQTRVAARNASLFSDLGVPLEPIEELANLVREVHRAADTATVASAVAAALELEERTLTILGQYFPGKLAEHFGPFLASLSSGGARHQGLLAGLRDRSETGPADAVPAHTQEQIEPVTPPLRHREPVRSSRPVLPDELLNHLDRQAFRQVLDALHEGAYVADRARRIVFWNAAAERITGFASSEMIGRHCQEDGLNHLDSDGCLVCGRACPLKVATEQGASLTREAHLHHKEGHRLPVTLTVCPLRNGSGTILGSIQLFHQEVTSADTGELERLAYVDATTGLPNRRFAETTLVSRLADLQRNGWAFGVIFFDLDHLKLVNDRRGHRAGDQLLRMVATTLSASVRTSDTVGRWGGDELVAVLSNVDETRLAAAAEKLRMLVERSSGWDGTGTLSGTVSVGFTLARPEDTVESVVSRADEHMYEAKRRGGNRVHPQPDAAVAAVERPERKRPLARLASQITSLFTAARA